ncbi:MAG: hypothetical protein OXF93_15215 [Acidobacteria bacterium]|nr:hypothetical protein [Acidobacteriota bacterium]
MRAHGAVVAAVAAVSLFIGAASPELALVLVSCFAFGATMVASLGAFAWMGSRTLNWTDRLYARRGVLVVRDSQWATTPRPTPDNLRNVVAWGFMGMAVVARILGSGAAAIGVQWLWFAVVVE